MSNEEMNFAQQKLTLLVNQIDEVERLAKRIRRSRYKLKRARKTLKNIRGFSFEDWKEQRAIGTQVVNQMKEEAL